MQQGFSTEQIKEIDQDKLSVKKLIKDLSEKDINVETILLYSKKYSPREEGITKFPFITSEVFNYLHSVIKIILSEQMQSTDSKKIEGNEVIFEDLGIYSRDPKKDKEINNRLIEFLKSKGVKLAKIKPKKIEPNF